MASQSTAYRCFIVTEPGREMRVVEGDFDAVRAVVGTELWRASRPGGWIEPPMWCSNDGQITVTRHELSLVGGASDGA